MKKISTIILVAFLFASVPARADAMPVNVWNPKEAEAESKLSPWFETIRQNIQGKTEFRKLVREIGSTYVSCSFKLAKNGDLEELKLDETSGSESIDRSAFNLIRACSPFNKPPNDLPYQKRIAITFSNKPSDIYPFNPEIALYRKGLGRGRFY
jgi:TonB family protein